MGNRHYNRSLQPHHLAYTTPPPANRPGARPGLEARGPYTEEGVLVEGGVSRIHSRRKRLYTSLNDDSAPFSCTIVSDVMYPDIECAYVTACSSTRNWTAFATAMTPAGSVRAISLYKFQCPRAARPAPRISSSLHFKAPFASEVINSTETPNSRSRRAHSSLVVSAS